jgi:hypothetical protein
MKYSLPPLQSLAPSIAPDLRVALRERKKSQRDVLLPASQGRFETECGRLEFSVEGRGRLLTEMARLSLADRLGLGRKLVGAPHTQALNEWRERQGDLLVRLGGEEVRGLLPAQCRFVDTLELLEATVQLLGRLSVKARIEHLTEEEGELHLTAVAPDLASEVSEGDYIYGGFYLAHSETTLLDTEASVRIYRVACRNGALIDCSEGQRLVLPRLVRTGAPDPYPKWPEKLSRVIARSFDGGDVSAEARRFRTLTSQILATPYEMLVHLEASGLISAEDRERIQREFNEGRDESMFALVNAVTYQAHGLRDRGDWGRAFSMERLGGEIIRGDHQPPVVDPVYA